MTQQPGAGGSHSPVGRTGIPATNGRAAAGPPLEHVFSPFPMGKVQLRNRIVVSAHTTNMGEVDDWRPSDRIIAYHRERARGGVGLIMTEGIRAHEPTWRRYRMGAFNDACAEGLAPLPAAVHAEGAAIVAQLNDSGRHLGSDRNGGISASSIPWATAAPVPHKLAEHEIGLLTEDFASAASRLEAAGFDGVEVHLGHGHLVHGFISPIVNNRTDGYGGSLENRLRFPIELLDAIFERVTFAVGIRVSASDMIPGGLEPDDVLEIVDRLVTRYPLAFVHVSHSMYASHPSLAAHVADMHFETTPFRHYAKLFKTTFPNVPIVAVCRVDDIADAEDILAAGDADLVAMTRAHITDPNLVAKAQAGRSSETRHCIACNQGCLGRLEMGLPISCVVNPEVGLEREWAAVKSIPPTSSRSVLVAGGGPAGLEAAVTAQLRGHRVELREARSVLGGQVRFGAALRGRARLGLLVDELELAARANGVELRVDSRVSADEVIAGDWDVVVAATGSVPKPAPIPGLRELTSTWDAIEAPGRLGESVVIVDEDGGWPAWNLAEHLASLGKRVEVVTRIGGVAPRINMYSRLTLTARLGELGVRARTLRRPVRVEGGVLIVADTMTGAEESLGPFTGFVRADPQHAADELVHELVARRYGGDIYLIGDGWAPRTTFEAVYEGRLAGTAIGMADLAAFQSLTAFRPPIRALTREAAVRAD